MNATKLAIAVVTTISVMGAVTFAYAQTTNPTPPASDLATQQPMSPSTQATPMDSTQGRNTMQNDTTMPTDGRTERMARADRN